VQESVLHLNTMHTAAGFLHLSKARVRWFLSIDEADLPVVIRAQGKRTYRSIMIDNQEFEFSDGFNDLHTLSYQKILNGEGFVLHDAQAYVTLCHQIRNAPIEWNRGERHPLITEKKYNHS